MSFPFRHGMNTEIASNRAFGSVGMNWKKMPTAIATNLPVTAGIGAMLQKKIAMNICSQSGELMHHVHLQQYVVQQERQHQNHHAADAEQQNRLEPPEPDDIIQ
jgi:hypothetical protein